jgi:TolB-like protein/Tfp pilus assembly protein PilF
MTDPSAPASEERNASPPAVAPGHQAPAAQGVWARLKQHKVAQWTLAYAAAAYTLLHVAEMVSEAMEWPHLIARVLTLVLVLGVPVVITLAWYHGARHAHRVSGPELTIITILLIIAGSVLWALGGEHATAPAAATGASRSASTGALTSVAPRTSVAVMPFANLTGDASMEYLGDGMAEEVINALTEVPGLKIPARTSSFAYKGRNTDIRQICRDLGVGTILEGSVRVAGKRIRITAQLINAQDGLHIWSHTYDEQFTDLFKLQDDLAKAIVQALQVNLHAEVPSIGAPAAPTQDLEAYQLYLQARSIGTSGAEPRLRDALKRFQGAIARDPKFARAYSGSAATRLTFVVLGYPLPNALDDAEHEAEKALALDPRLAEAQSILGQTDAVRGNWLKSEAHFRAAIALDTRDPATRTNYSSFVLNSVGHMRHAISESREAYRLAPADPTSVMILATMNSIVGLDAEAIKFANLAVGLGVSPDVTPTPQIYNNAAVRNGRYAEAADRAVANLPAALRTVRGAQVMRRVYAAFGDNAQKATAREALHQLLHSVPPDELDVNTRKDLIALFAQLDDLDDAFEVAQRSLELLAQTGTVGSSWGVLWLPEMRAFRRDPRFKAFAGRLGLVEFWQQYGAPDECDLKDGKLTCH